MASDSLAPDPSSDEEEHGESDNTKKKKAALRAWKRASLLYGLVVFTVAVVCLQVVLWRSRDGSSATQQAPSFLATFDQLRSSAADLIASEQQASEEQKRRRVKARLELRRLEGLAQLRLSEPLGERYEASRRDWRALISETAESDAGRRLLANPEVWEQAVALKQLTEQMTPVAWRELMQRLVQDLTEATGESRMETCMQQASQLDKQLAAATADLLGCRKQLEALLQQTASLAPVEQATGDVFAWREQQVAAKVREQAENAGLEEGARIDQELNELAEQRLQLLSVAEQLKTDLDNIKRGVTPAPSAPTTVDMAAYRDRLAEMRRLLRPFLTPGYAQPSGDGALAMETTKRPMSYSALRLTGAFEDTEAGWATLFRLGGGKTEPRRNDRPLGDFPRMNSEAELAKPSVKAKVRRAQQLLRDYGPQLVSDRLLTQ